MRILVTGAGGFVGRHLVDRLAPRHEVIALDRVLPVSRAARRIEGDLADPAMLAEAFATPSDHIIHLATVPGGAAEADPGAAWRVNVGGSVALLDAARRGGACPRFIFASSIAVLGEVADRVDDDTPPRPRLIYGAHKAMIEQWIAMLTRRGAIAGVSLRLPGIVARPEAASGMKSAFLSDVFHALRAGRPFVSPVSPDATVWLMSVDRITRNIEHTLRPDFVAREPFALTLPTVRTTMAALVGAIAARAGVPATLVDYDPDPMLEAGFGRQPPLTAKAAEAAGFTGDGDLVHLVETAFATLETA